MNLKIFVDLLHFTIMNTQIKWPRFFSNITLQIEIIIIFDTWQHIIHSYY